jgi:hypothetical protein
MVDCVPNLMTETTKSGFHTTNWTLVQSAAVDSRGPTADSPRALSTLSQTYWHRVYAFIRRNAYDPDHSQDLTRCRLREIGREDGHVCRRPVHVRTSAAPQVSALIARGDH